MFFARFTQSESETDLDIGKKSPTNAVSIKISKDGGSLRQVLPS